MPWDKDYYPDSWKNLSEPVRNKAIEIGNELLSKGEPEAKTIAIATSQAKKRAQNRDISIQDS